MNISAILLNAISGVQAPTQDGHANPVSHVLSTQPQAEIYKSFKTEVWPNIKTTMGAGSP